MHPKYLIRSDGSLRIILGIPEKYDSYSLGKTLAQRFSENEKILLLSAEKPSAELTDILCKNNLSYDNIKIYDIEKIISEKIFVDDDYIVFGSSSGVEAFFESGGDLSADTEAVCIGTPTTITLKDFYNRKVITAEEHTVRGIIDIIIRNERSDHNAEITQTAFV